MWGEKKGRKSLVAMNGYKLTCMHETKIQWMMAVLIDIHYDGNDTMEKFTGNTLILQR